MEDEHNLQKFLDAQADSIDSVLEELREGQKRGHWMWYIFPQIQGLGRSRTSQLYAIGSMEEASAYLSHPILGRRLIECTEVVNAHADCSAEQIFGHPDVLKFRSSMTLFEIVAGQKNPFHEALVRFYAGEPDSKTLGILRKL
jgi:uncharacterized protein (DUF1810 family)